jgi:hypothetical protein
MKEERKDFNESEIADIMHDMRSLFFTFWKFRHSALHEIALLLIFKVYFNLFIKQKFLLLVASVRAAVWAAASAASYEVRLWRCIVVTKLPRCCWGEAHAVAVAGRRCRDDGSASRAAVAVRRCEAAPEKDELVSS